MTAALDRLKQQALEHRQRRRALQEMAAANAECVPFERWRWYRLPLVAGKMGLERGRFYRYADRLTTKRSSQYGGVTLIQADEQLVALAKELYINIQLLG